MRAVVQRVASAEVCVEGECVASIETGLLVLLGVAQGDTEQDAEYLARKITGLRVFEDDQRRMNRDLAEVRGQLLVVSQFTLLGDCRKGRRPSFIDAAEPREADRLYEHFMTVARREGIDVLSGRFQAFMQVSLVNDGPVTLLLDSGKRF